ncbi:helix-turn-helix transcriptional regulator [Lachnospiraceae bacterium 47-T17]
MADSHPDIPDFQEKLCALLQSRGCDIGRSTYAKYENGELNIKVSVIIELRKIYNCTYDDFFKGLDIQEQQFPSTSILHFN